MKIMILSSEFDPFRGGIGSYAREMALAATELGHRVTVVAADYGEKEGATSFPFRVLRYPGGQHHMRDIPAKIALVRRLARQEPAYDIVHAVDWPFYIPLALSAYRKGTRCILTFHGTEVDFIQRPIRSVLLSLLRFWNGWAHYIANSHNTAGRLRMAVGLEESAVRVVHPGVGREWLAGRVEKGAARHQLGTSERQFVIATLGRVVPRKGHDVLVQALRLLPAEVIREIEWHIIGPLLDKTYEAQLRRMTESLGCRVVFHGALAQDEISLRLSAADVFCLPGRQLDGGGVEGFGLVYLEAGAFGLPSVAADTGGISEAIDDGEGGLLVPENDPHTLAAAILRLHADPAERRRLSKGARHRAEASTWLRAAGEIYGCQNNHPGARHVIDRANGDVMLTGGGLPATRPRPVVVFLINSLTGGGAERVMAGLLGASSAWAQHYELHLILLDRETDAYPLPEWLTVHRLDSRFSLGRSIRLSLLLLRRLKPAVCLSFLTRANIVAVTCSRLCGFRAIISERVSPTSHHGKGLRGVFARQTTRFFYPLAHRIICPSAGVASDLVEGYRVARGRISVIPNPLDIDDIRNRATAVAPWQARRPYIVAVGRLVENKNFALLLSAIGKSRTSLDLVILGEGQLRRALEEDAFRLGLGGRIHFPGFVENPFPIIAQAEFFVSSSNAEGFPNAVVEAMALGVPVISTNCRSGPAEILGEHEGLSIDRLHEARYGMLVPVGDEDALAEAIGKMTNGVTRDRYREAALLGATRFSSPAALQRYWNVIEEQIGHPVRKTDEADFA